MHRLEATTLIHGDCRQKIKSIDTNSVDVVFCDPPYPEIKRRSDDYPQISEADWFDLMKEVVRECKRIVKPTGSAVFILQPNYEKLGKMRLWLWDFVSWAGREWNLIQDCWWWATDAMPLAGTQRKNGLMRQSVKMCVWLGQPNCFRNQEAVLWTPAQATLADHASARYRGDDRLRSGPSGRTFRQTRFAKVVEERGGTTPFNLLPIASGPSHGARERHPAATSYELAAWWCRYLLPEHGVLADPMCGSGTSLVAGLNNGARHVIGIDRVRKYLGTARRWVMI
jgi:DNA modification methylase